MGKTEGTGKNWHGHVTAITVAPEYRRLGLAEGMMNLLEEVSEKVYDGWFVDLYVRVSNAVAVDMYRKFGYSVYRRVRNYYAGQTNEDAFGNEITHIQWVPKYNTHSYNFLRYAESVT